MESFIKEKKMVHQIYFWYVCKMYLTNNKVDKTSFLQRKHLMINRNFKKKEEQTNDLRLQNNLFTIWMEQVPLPVKFTELAVLTPAGKRDDRLWQNQSSMVGSQNAWKMRKHSNRSVTELQLLLVWWAASKVFRFESVMNDSDTTQYWVPVFSV